MTKEVRQPHHFKAIQAGQCLEGTWGKMSSAIMVRNSTSNNQCFVPCERFMRRERSADPTSTSTSYWIKRLSHGLKCRIFRGVWALNSRERRMMASRSRFLDVENFSEPCQQPSETCRGVLHGHLHISSVISE